MNNFTQKESELCWLVGLKAISTKQSMMSLWIKNEQRKLDPQQLKNEFLKQFQSGFLRLNSLITGDRNKNAQIIKGLSDVTIIALVRVIREEIKELEYLKNDFQKLITVITYLILTRSVMSDAVMKFLSSQQVESHQYVENLLVNLQKIESMKNLANKQDPLKETAIYKFIFGKGVLYDPFSDSSDQISPKQTVLPIEEFCSESSVDLVNRYIVKKPNKESDSEIQEIPNFKA